jgi:hypothetical protein
MCAGHVVDGEHVRNCGLFCVVPLADGQLKSTLEEAAQSQWTQHPEEVTGTFKALFPNASPTRYICNTHPHSIPRYANGKWTCSRQPQTCTMDEVSEIVGNLSYVQDGILATIKVRIPASLWGIVWPHHNLPELYKTCRLTYMATMQKQVAGTFHIQDFHVVSVDVAHPNNNGPPAKKQRSMPTEKQTHPATA